MKLNIQLLGPMRATVKGEAVAESRTKRIEALLAYLAVEPDRPHRRENLVGLLFPDLPDEQARMNLRQTLTRLRRTIFDADANPPFLVTTRESTRLNPDADIRIDVDQFKRWASGCKRHNGQRRAECLDCMARASKAIDLYRGPFMEGFFLEESSDFEDWLAAQRENWQELVLDLASELVSFYELRGEYLRAEKIARLQTRIEPWEEGAHMTLMRLQAYQGKRTTALKQYEKLKAILWEELAVEPIPEAASLRQQIAVMQTTRPRKLPGRLDGFVGRSTERGQLNQLLTLGGQRLVTLLGPGGSGKTTLVTEIGWQLVEQFASPFFHGIFLVPLATISPDSGQIQTQIVNAIADTLEFSFSGREDPIDELGHYLQERSLLLILDNCEHLVRQVRAVLMSLLSHTKQPVFLVTSRVRLNITQEWVLTLAGLPVPKAQEVVEAGALELFWRHAMRLMPDSNPLTNGDRCSDKAALQICQMVAGLPLGIELAASWVRYMDCQEIVTEMSDNLSFLGSGRPDQDDRHQSLEAVFAYSWQLLAEPERLLLQKLTVFAGSFNRQAAIQIMGATISSLGMLVDHSLLQQQQGSRPRFNLLTVLRQFAQKKLASQPEKQAELQHAHASYYLQLVADNELALQGETQQAALSLLEDEWPNIQAAWQWAVTLGDIELLQQGLGTLMLFYYIRSRFTEGEAMFRAATAALAERSEEAEIRPVWAQLNARHGWFTFLLGRQEQGRQLLAASATALAESGPITAHSFALSYLATATYNTGSFNEAAQLAARARELTLQAKDHYGQIVAYNVSSQIHFLQEDFAAARTFSLHSLRLERAGGNRWSRGFSLTNLGRVALIRQEYGLANDYFSEALSIRQGLSDARGQALSYMLLGETAAALQDNDAAKNSFAEALAIYTEIGNRVGMAEILTMRGKMLARSEEMEQALRDLQRALQLASEQNNWSQMLNTTLELALLGLPAGSDSTYMLGLIARHPASPPAARSQALARLDGADPLANETDFEAAFMTAVPGFLK